MSGLCGSAVELHWLLEKRCHQGEEKSLDGLGRWISDGLHMAKTE